MDLEKIGKFIAENRKKQKLTQEQLAEKLLVTDRAVSKWERGLCLPDASKMLELCDILKISVNELLIGEEIKMEDEKKKTEELLLQLAKKEELKNKKLYLNMWVSGLIIVIFYLALTITSCLILEKGPILGAIIGVSTVIFVLACFYLVKLDLDAGFYECKCCHHKFNPSYFEATITPHLITARYLKCPKCGKHSWSKKVMKK